MTKLLAFLAGLILVVGLAWVVDQMVRAQSKKKEIASGGGGSAEDSPPPRVTPQGRQ